MTVLPAWRESEFLDSATAGNVADPGGLIDIGDRLDVECVVVRSTALQEIRRRLQHQVRSKTEVVARRCR